MSRIPRENYREPISMSQYRAIYSLDNHHYTFSWSDLNTVREIVIKNIGGRKGKFSCTIERQWEKGYSVYSKTIGTMTRDARFDSPNFYYIDDTGKRWQLSRDGKTGGFINTPRRR